MNLQQLKYFRTIAEYEHYSRAAEALGVNQSSLSHAIQALERELDAELFIKRGRNIALSTHGRMFLPHIETALAEIEEGVEELQRAIAPDTGIVTIACFPSLAEFVPDIIVRYISETNRVDARLHSSQKDTYYELRDQLLSGAVDLVFATEIEDTRVKGVLVGEQSFVLLVPEDHRPAEQDSVELHELDGEDFIAYSKGSQLRHQADAYFRSHGIRPRIKAETAQDVMIYGLVAAGHGVSITPWPLGGAPYRVKLLPIKGMHKRKLYLMWSEEKQMPPAAACFRDFVVEKGPVFDEYRQRNNIQ